MNTPLLIPSANIANKNPVFLTGPALSDTAVWLASANKEYLTIPSNASLQTGDISYEFADWLRFDTVGTVDWVVGKDGEWKIDLASNILRFGTYASGAWTYVSASTFGALSTATWYFVRVWRDNTPSVGANIIANGDFETAGVGGADVFGSWGENAASGKIEKRTDSVHSGTAALKLASIPASGYPNVLSPHIAVVPGKSYRLKVWSAGDGVHSGRGRIYDNSHSSVLYEITDMGNVTSEYQLYEYTFTAPAGCSDIQIYLFSPFAATSYASYDDLSLTEMISGTINISVNNGVANSASADANTAGANPLVFGKGTGYYNGRMDSAYFTKTLSTAGYATTLYNSGLGFTSTLAQQYLTTFWSNLISWWDFNSESGTQYDSKGGNHLTASADAIIAPPVYGSELIVNGGFETAGAGGADVFGSWVETASDGAIADETTSVRSGSHAAKITSGATTGGTAARVAYNSITVTARASYYLSFWSRGDGANAGRYVVYDVSNSAYIYNLVSTQNKTTTYQLYTVQFTAPAGCTDIRFYLYAGAVTGAIAYFDDISVKQITTPSINNGGFDLRPATGGEKTNVSTVSRSRTSNVATMVATAHGLKNNDVVTITGMTDTSFNGTSKTVTVVDVDTFTYASTGSDAGIAGDTGGRIATDVFSSWGEIVIGASTLNAETTTPRDGSYAVRLDIDSSNSNATLAQPILVIGKKYSYSLYSKSNSAGQKLKVSSSGVPTATSFTLTANYDLYSGSLLADNANIYIYRDIANSSSIYIDQVTLTSLGPTAEAGIASGLALNTNGVSKVLNDGWNAGSFAQITLAKRPLFSTAYFGGCLLFDGVDDGLVMTGDKIGIGDVTVTAVIKPRSWGGGGGGRIIDSNAFNIRATNYNSYNSISVYSGSSDSYSATSSITFNTSYVVVITRTSAGVVNIYINGVLSGTANQNSGTPAAGSDTYIGNRAAYDRAFAGYIGKVGVINRILSIGEIMAMSRWLSVQSGGIY